MTMSSHGGTSSGPSDDESNCDSFADTDCTFESLLNDPDER